MKKRFYRELIRVFGCKVQDAKMLNTTPSNLLNLMLVFCLTFRDKRSTFSRESKHRRNYTGVFVTMKKKFYQDLNSGLWIQSPRC